jgi:hypothetical protein
MKLCTVPDCGAKHYGRGLCNKHWQQRPERKAYAHAYHTDPINLKSALARSRSPEGKAYQQAYNKTDKCKAAKKAQKIKVVARFAEGKRLAKKRGIVWNITFEEFTVLRLQACRYCGFPLPLWGHGLDRVDDAKEYSQSNVVPCCGDCNRIRGTGFTSEEMLRLGPVVREVKLARTHMNEVK